MHKPTSAFPIFILCSVSAQMPDGLDFEELSSNHLFSLDFDMLRNVDDVCPVSFLLLCSLLKIQKACHGL